MTAPREHRPPTGPAAPNELRIVAERPVTSPAEASTAGFEPPTAERTAPDASPASVWAFDRTAAPTPVDSSDPILITGALPTVDPLARYEMLGVLGRGGMGEVHRVRDRVLNREVAMKLVRSDLASQTELAARFIEEAQIAGQLDHPCIPPVHDRGRTPDGRIWFTMKLVRGRPLADVLRSFHGAVSGGVWPVLEDGISLPRLLQIFLRICEAVAFAHSRAVIHRDLKPANVMIGAFGEVYVMDWGLAKPLGDRSETLSAERVLTTPRADGLLRETSFGAMMGTASYAAPEQVRGDPALTGPHSDVYSLGAMLHEILAGRPPRAPHAGGEAQGGEALSVAQTLARPDHPPVPEELVTVCERALAQEPAGRYPEAGALGAAVAAWLEGATRREKALALVSSARAQLPQAKALRDEANTLRDMARARLLRLPADAAVEASREAWMEQDRAAELTLRARLIEVEGTQNLRAALAIVPDLPEARSQLALYHRDRVLEAELAGDQALAAEHELLLQGCDQGILATWLRGEGQVTLHTDPPGAEVELYQFEELDRRLAPVFLRDLGRTPLQAVVLPRGSYLLRLRAPSCEVVDYPVSIERQGVWSGLAPGGEGALPVHLPRRGAVGPEECYVPAGPFQCGGDPLALDALPRQWVWVDGFVMRRYPVRLGEYLEFLNDVAAQDGADAALRHAPRERGGLTADGRPLVTRTPGGVFVVDAVGEAAEERARLPVLSVSWDDATAYAAWHAVRTRQPWRLPHELEMEKASRGVDGRPLPWGQHFHLAWALVSGAQPGMPHPCPVGHMEGDVGPYGVRDVAGSCRTWCRNVWSTSGGIQDGRLAEVPPPNAPNDGKSVSVMAARGGAWNSMPAYARPAGRFGSRPDDVFTGCGLRLVRAACSPSP